MPVSKKSQTSKAQPKTFSRSFPNSTNKSCEGTFTSTDQLSRRDIQDASSTSSADPTLLAGHDASPQPSQPYMLESKLDVPTKTLFTSKYDIEMAKRQVNMMTLAPSQKAEQEEWAQDQLKKNACSNCPVGLIWIRKGNGYRCLGGGHYVSDQLLAEGKGGYFNGGVKVLNGKPTKPGFGPHYGPDPEFGELSAEEAAAIRLRVFGTENPTEKDKKW